MRAAALIQLHTDLAAQAGFSAEDGEDDTILEDSSPADAVEERRPYEERSVGAGGSQRSGAEPMVDPWQQPPAYARPVGSYEPSPHTQQTPSRTPESASTSDVPGPVRASAPSTAAGVRPPGGQWPQQDRPAAPTAPASAADGRQPQAYPVKRAATGHTNPVVAAPAAVDPQLSPNAQSEPNVQQPPLGGQQADYSAPIENWQGNAE